MKRFFFIYLFLLGYVCIGYSQSFQWIKQAGDKSGDQTPVCKLLANGSSIVGWYFADSTKIDKFKTKFPSFINPGIVAYLDKNGATKWIWTPDSCLGNMTINSISYSESSAKIFVCGNFSNGATINKVKYKGTNTGFVLRLDTNGGFEKIYTLFDSSGIGFETMDITSKSEIVVGIGYGGKKKTYPPFSIPSLSFSISEYSCFLLKLSPDLKPIKVSEPAIGKRAGRHLLTISSDNTIINGYSYNDTFKLGSMKYFNGVNVFSNYVTYLDSNLKIKKTVLLFKTKSTMLIQTLKTLPNNSLVIGGHFRDSISLIPKTSFGPSYVPLFACFDSNLNLKWVKTPIIIDKKQGISTQIYDICVNGDYIYAGGIFTGDAIYQDFNLPRSTGIFWFFKTDKLGNILWMQKVATSNSLQYISSISANNQKEVLLSGYIIDTVKLDNKVYFTAKSKADIFLMKIHDIEIYRGYVKSGPYCAGDTIKIPYTKDGDFNSGNEFIAQLSDADGNFNGKERELGRIKSTTAGTIKGPLPLFEVESSPHYRIRIISTSPVVQSYYKYDTLRLLIYSKDKANPGQTETLCQGDSLQLKTYGGTKWTWSPKYNMNDSSLKKPWVWPTKTTNYKLIIADSSGCGKPDTAFKKIIVRPPLKIKMAYTDITVCDTSVLKIAAAFEGGDSVNYSWQWVSGLRAAYYKPLKNGKQKLTDTLAYKPKVSLNANDTVALVLSDNCTNINDTAYVIIRLQKPTLLIKKWNDTTLCIGNKMKLKAGAKYAQTYQWQWDDLTHNKIISTTDSLEIIADSTVKIKLSVSNGCTKDSNLFSINVRLPLKAITNLRDTAICEGQSLNYTAQASGGDSKKYSYSWVLNGKQISTINNLSLTINNSSTLFLILTDNCTALSDTVRKTITVNGRPKANFSNGITCSLTSTNFKFTGTKPTSPVTTSFNWNFNNEATSTIENPSYLFTVKGNKFINLKLTSSNGCNDSIEKIIEIKPQSKADFTAADVCESDSVIFKNLSQDATSYTWKFGDGQNSKSQNPRHKYQITTSTTFNVTLVAEVTGGCSDSINKPVTINANPKSDFSYSSNQNMVTFSVIQTETLYKWQFGNGDSATSTNKDYTYTYPKNSGIYLACLKVLNTANCFSKTCKEVLITVGIFNITEAVGFKIYPNPNSGFFTLEISEPAKDASIEVYDLMGRMVKKIERAEKINSVELDVEAGIYLVKVRNGVKVWNTKVVVSVSKDTNR